MSGQSTISEQKFNDSIVRTVWLLASLVPAVFLLYLFALTFYAAPEHDDFCFFAGNLHTGLINTVLNYYFGLSGRVAPFLLIQVPGAIAKEAGVGILPAYSITLMACMIALLAGGALAIIRALPGLPAGTTLFLGLGFSAAIIGATPSIHDLLYWLSGLVCYVPAGIVSILILGECVRGLNQKGGFSWVSTCAMATAGLIAATCNEFTAAWLIGMLISSLLARHCLGRELQIGHHALIAAAILIGWAIVVSAPGNSIRLAQTGGVRTLGFVIPRALNYALIDLGRFLVSPTVVAWSFVVAAVTIAKPNSIKPTHPRGALLAVAIAVFCLVSCYIAYFAHHFTTGVRLVERAQNQALILLLFGITLSISLLASTYHREIRQRLPLSDVLSLDSVRLPAVLAGVIAASLYMSATVSRLRSERETFYPFWQESIARDRMLTTSLEPVVVVRKHRWRPSALWASDVTENTDCLESYYNKSRIIPAEFLVP